MGSGCDPPSGPLDKFSLLVQIMFKLPGFACCHYFLCHKEQSYTAVSTNLFSSCFLWNKITFVSLEGEKPDPFEYLMVTLTFSYQFFQHLQHCVTFPKCCAHGFTNVPKMIHFLEELFSAQITVLFSFASGSLYFFAKIPACFGSYLFF